MNDRFLILDNENQSISISHAPGFSAEWAELLAGDLFGITSNARSLPSERDQNFLLKTDIGSKFVLKIANALEVQEFLEAQNAVLDYIEKHDSSLHCPHVVPARTGERIVTIQSSEGSSFFVRMLSYIPGSLLIDTRPHTPKLLESLGAFFGRLDRALTSFSNSALQREIQWDLGKATSVVALNIGYIPDSEQRGMVERMAERFEKCVEPALPHLRRSVIHNDGNDYNVLVTDIHALGGKVTGVIDFGDLLESHTIFELAICVAYAILSKTDPLAAAVQVVKGYHSLHPITQPELELLYDLIVMRLCMSVVISARQKTCQPENAYLTVSEGPVWDTLNQITRLSPQLFYYAFRDACRLPPCPKTIHVIQWLKDHPDLVGSVVQPEIRKGDAIVFDRSPGSMEFIDVPDPYRHGTVPPKRCSRGCGQAGVNVGIGRYNEANRAYTASGFRDEGK